jgi:fucose 4-O-acetylase-like acetyltransferase/poly-gamma-glutamate capsule biosynthesis protein CapA/YwtB (metallophosphatase superfamily)/lysophospholipase L1-like esterase
MTAAETNSNRIPYWDNLKGVLIALVVFGHYLFEYRDFSAIREATYLIYAFHMPAFVFVSGYFSRSERSTSDETLVKILIWFVLLNFSMMFYAYFYADQPFSFVRHYYSSWYLLALFLYRATLPLCRKIPLIVPLSVAVSLGVGFIRTLDDVWALQKIIALYPFFIVGALPSTDTMERFVAGLQRHHRAGWIGLAALLLLILWLILRDSIGFNEVLWYSYNSRSDAAKRLLELAVSGGMIVVLLAITPRVSIPLLNRWGRNSLSIYVTHRIFTLLAFQYFPLLASGLQGILRLAIVSFATLLVLGSKRVNGIVNRALDYLAETLAPAESVRHLRAGIVCSLLLAGFLFGAYGAQELGQRMQLADFGQTARNALDRMKIALHLAEAREPECPRVLTAEEAKTIREAVSIAYVGDLILLREQVCNAYDRKTGRYEFDSLFEYTRRYLKEADLAVGVFEGPMAGDRVEYSTSDYDDGIPLYLNFPDSFAESVKKAGIGLVSTATNHLLDRGVAGAMRTLDVLDRVGLAHVGSYRSRQEKGDRDILMLDVKGLKIAMLAYTYGTNTQGRDSLFDPQYAHLTSVLADPRSPRFQESKEAVLGDFERAKAKNPDCIVVLPHLDGQFNHVPNRFQRTWADVFIEAGADVVLADHSHAVQPIEWRPSRRSGRKHAIIVYCPGNYVNSYTKSDGDAMALVDVYLNPKTGEPLAAGVVPMWGQSPMNGNYRALPIYDVMHNERLQKEISSRDLGRVREVHAVVTSVMLGRELSLDQIQDRYYLLPDGYVRSQVAPLEITPAMRSSRLYRMLANAKSACFIGDSVTAGTRNGGYGWYEPLASAFPNLTVYRRAWGSHTARMLLERKDEMLAVAADVYVIAIGTNDVRYRDADRCCLTPEEYVENVDRLVKEIKGRHPQAQFVLIGAWTTDHYDPVSALDEKQRMETLARYRAALGSYCGERRLLYIDPNPGIEKVLRVECPRKYLKDHIHPDADRGIRLYSAEVLNASE